MARTNTQLMAEKAMAALLREAGIDPKHGTPIEPSMPQYTGQVTAPTNSMQMLGMSDLLMNRAYPQVSPFAGGEMAQPSPMDNFIASLYAGIAGADPRVTSTGIPGSSVRGGGGMPTAPGTSPPGARPTPSPGPGGGGGGGGGVEAPSRPAAPVGPGAGPGPGGAGWTWGPNGTKIPYDPRNPQLPTTTPRMPDITTAPQPTDVPIPPGPSNPPPGNPHQADNPAPGILPDWAKSIVNSGVAAGKTVEQAWKDLNDAINSVPGLSQVWEGAKGAAENIGGGIPGMATGFGQGSGLFGAIREGAGSVGDWLWETLMGNQGGGGGGGGTGSKIIPINPI